MMSMTGNAHGPGINATAANMTETGIAIVIAPAVRAASATIMREAGINVEMMIAILERRTATGIASDTAAETIATSGKTETVIMILTVTAIMIEGIGKTARAKCAMWTDLPRKNAMALPLRQVQNLAAERVVDQMGRTGQASHLAKMNGAVLLRIRVVVEIMDSTGGGAPQGIPGSRIGTISMVGDVRIIATASHLLFLSSTSIAATIEIDLMNVDEERRGNGIVLVSKMTVIGTEMAKIDEDSCSKCSKFWMQPILACTSVQGKTCYCS